MSAGSHGRSAVRAFRLLALSALLAFLPSLAAAVQPLAVGNAVTYSDPFTSDPRTSGKWELSGTWAWTKSTHTLVSPRTGTAAVTWAGQGYQRVKATTVLTFPLSGAKGPEASIVLGLRDDGSFWHATLYPTRVILGRSTGTFPGVTLAKATLIRPIPSGSKQTFAANVAPDGTVTLTLNGGTVLKKKLTALDSTGTALPWGWVGLRGAKGQIKFDSFAVTSWPNTDKCQYCHAGQPEHAPAPSMYTYWDGSWWAANGNGGTGAQRGGHGDSDNKPATTCIGTTGCHDLTRQAASHRDGTLNGKGAATANSYHLRQEFIVASVINPSDVQENFDSACKILCHKAYALGEHDHEATVILEPPNGEEPGALFGTHRTTTDMATIPWPVDQDLSIVAAGDENNYLPCVGCHDPHGTETQDTKGLYGSNIMLRAAWTDAFGNALCNTCH